MKLEFRNIRKHYGSKQALKGINLTLTEGVYGMLGPNGAGKSTLMNILSGNLEQSDGEIRLDGADIRSLGSAYRARLGYMPQQQTFYPSFTVERFLYYIASLKGMSKNQASQRIDWTLGLLSLEGKRKAKIRSLSGGMKQRLLLAQAILADPDILILDEPTAGLDPKQRIAVRNLISEIALHKLILISTHVVSDVELIAKELILLSDGQVVCQDTALALEQKLTGMVWDVYTDEKHLLEVTAMGTVCGLRKEDGQLVVRLLSKEEPRIPATTVKPNLEDVYLDAFGDMESVWDTN